MYSHTYAHTHCALPGVVLYEYLGEEYPEVLGSILGALKSIVNVIGMTKMTPPIKELLPRLTPILKNRHEKVQENCIDLVGRIARRVGQRIVLAWSPTLGTVQACGAGLGGGRPR